MDCKRCTANVSTPKSVYCDTCIRYNNIQGKKRYHDLNLLEVGDRIFEDADSGPCSGGARYGLHETVTSITKKVITTDGEYGRYDRKKGNNLTYPMYSIQFFLKPPFKTLKKII